MLCVGNTFFVYIFSKGQGDPQTCSTIANQFVSNNVDLILANATPAFQSAAAATAEIPILGTSVTEYGVALNLEGFDGTVGGNISGTSDLLVSLRWVKEFAFHNPLITVGLVVIILIGVLYWFFGTEMGCGLRATGANLNMSRAQGINTSFNKVIGIMLSNGLVAFSGAFLSQYQGFADVKQGQGKLFTSALYHKVRHRKKLPETSLIITTKHRVFPVLLCG